MVRALLVRGVLLPFLLDYPLFSGVLTYSYTWHSSEGHILLASLNRVVLLGPRRFFRQPAPRIVATLLISCAWLPTPP